MTGIERPDLFEALLRLIMLRDPNTRVVLLGTGILGACSGVIGVFTLLRKRALIGDALSHAALPGLCLAFLFVGEKSFLALLFGALLTGILGVFCVMALTRWTRIPEDASLGIVLSVFFGAGLCLSRYIQNNRPGNQSGLDGFIFGKAASLLQSDTIAIACIAVFVLALCVCFFKEFRLLCFDREYAATTGWPVFIIDTILMSCVVLTTIVGLQSVGVVLIIALLITPAATARLWTDRLSVTVVLAGIFGMLSALTGSAASALTINTPTGPLIVLVSALLFGLSVLLAPEKGIIATYRMRSKLERRIKLENLLRKSFELVERKISGPAVPRVALQQEFPVQSLSALLGSDGRIFRATLKRAMRQQLLVKSSDDARTERLRFTEAGLLRAQDVVRNHRLWELYLIHYADIAPSHVDVSADRIEHILPADTIEALHRLLGSRADLQGKTIPPSPHAPTHETTGGPNA